MPSDQFADNWTSRFEAQVLGARNVRRHAEQDYLFRPGHVLIHRDDIDAARRDLDRYGATVHSARTSRLRDHGIPVEVFRLADEHAAEVPSVVQQLRGALGTREVGVSPVHVFVGGPGYTPGGVGDPEPAPAASEQSAPPEGEPVVAILDTGLPRKLADWHAGLAEATVAISGEDGVDELDADDDGYLDLEAGHGTFIAGLLRDRAPAIRFTVERVLEPCGVGDELEITDAVRRATAPILSMSFGTYTHDDLPPLALAAAVAGVVETSDRLVVASAGNGGEARPAYPAALPGVVAVGALVDATQPYRRAAFSNCGDWVDACAPGVELLSTYVEGRYLLGAPDAGDPRVEVFDRWARWSGTSFAVPQVVAAIANRMRRDGCSARVAWERLRDERDGAFVEGLGYAIV